VVWPIHELWAQATPTKRAEKTASVSIFAAIAPAPLELLLREMWGDIFNSKGYLIEVL
jgi:hypothetical protein